MAIFLLVVGLILFVSLVVVHEFGHFIVARRNSVEVEEFGIGFPPRAKVIKRHNGTKYTLNWLPLGGFVKLKGEHDEDTKPGTYGAATLWIKTKILLAGVAMNFLAAAVLFTILAATAMPRADLKSLPFYDKEQFTVASDTSLVDNKVYVSVVEGSPADRAGIKTGDELISVGGQEVDRAEGLSELTESFRGQSVNVEYVQSGQERSSNIVFNQERSDQGYLGVAAVNSEAFRSTWSAPIVGVATTAQFVDVSMRGLGYVVENLVGGQPQVASEAVGGPVATFKILSDTSSLGITQVLFVVALISVSLGVMNVLPIPALDGGRLFVTLLFRGLKKPLKKDVEEWIHGTGFALLMLLIVVITVVDVRRFF